MSRVDPDIARQHLFGHWRFDADTGDLFNGEAVTHLEPQVAKLLDYFLANQHSLISREELIAEVWDGRIVSDDAINRCVSRLRQVLSPGDKNAYIETVVRKGFLCHFPPAPAEDVRATAPRHRRTLLLLVLLAVLTVALFYGVTEKNPGSAEAVQATPLPDTPMLAVLPFTSSSMTDESEFFANGMHDDLLTQLAQLQSIRVISRTSVLEYQDTNRNIREIGRELGADAILEGGIQQIGDRIRINVQLIDARSDAHLWAEQYDRELLPANIFEVQSEIARSISTGLHTSLTEQEAVQLRILPTENMAAYRAYHRAMDVRDSLGVNDPEYIRSLQEAVRLDPKFTRAWAELAGYLSYRSFSQHDPDAIHQAEQMLEKIRTLAPNSADYLIAQSFFTYYILKDFEKAYQLINQAQRLKPSDAQIHDLKGWIQRRLGDIDGRIESIRQVRKLDPRNPKWTQSLVVNLIINHQYDEAGREIENTASPDFIVSILNSKLKLRHDRDPGRWVSELVRLQNEFEESEAPPDLWEALIFSRDFAAAEQLVDDLSMNGLYSYQYLRNDRVGMDILKLISYWFLQDPEKLGPGISRARAALDEKPDSSPEYLVNIRLLLMAYVTATEGNREETRRLIRTWRRASESDLAYLNQNWHHSCRALGMAAATEDAIECLERGLVQPSYVMPFLEPYLPFYDSMRDDPRFARLLAGLNAFARGL